MPDPLLTGFVLQHSASPHAVDNTPRKASRFSLDHFIRETDVRPCRYGANRHYQGLWWYEHDNKASLSARIQFTHCLVNRIIAMDLPRQRPLTLISLGSGGLLAEFLISRLLTDEGFSQQHWRCIDVVYGVKNHDAAVSAFRERSGTRIEIFATEQGYLYPRAGERYWAFDDRDEGAAILLSMAPPTMTTNELTPPEVKALEGCVCMRGNITEELEEANSVNIIFAGNNDIDIYYNELTTACKDSNKIIWLNLILKCSVNDLGHFDIVHGADKYADVIFTRLATQLHDIWQRARREGEARGDAAPVLGLPHVITAFGLIRTLWPPLPVTLKLFLFNDYDIALTGLRAFFRDGSRSTLFASFENNDTAFE